jgi:hypothetical protein
VTTSGDGSGPGRDDCRLGRRGGGTPGSFPSATPSLPDAPGRAPLLAGVVPVRWTGAQPQRRVSEGRDRDHRDRPPRLPAGLSGSRRDGRERDRPHAPPAPHGATAASLTRAALEVYEATPAAAAASPGASIDRIPFQFNPKELSISKSGEVGAQDRAGREDRRPPEFTVRDPCKLTLELFFDATDTMDGKVVSRVDQLFHCCVPTDDSLGKKKASPPLVVLQWGKVKSFAGFVTSVQAKYTLFTAQGTPIRATCNVSIEEMPGNPPKQNPTSGGLALTSVRTVVAGDSLASIAYRSTATRRCGARSPRSTASTTRCGCGWVRPSCCRPSTTSWPGCDVAEAQISNAFTISVDGTPCRPTSSRCSCRRTSTTA